MTPEEIIREQAQKLGGGWRMEHGVMPVVVLTTVEAAVVIESLKRPPFSEKVSRRLAIEEHVRLAATHAQAAYEQSFIEFLTDEKYRE